jgi:hypothetical protein
MNESTAVAHKGCALCEESITSVEQGWSLRRNGAAIQENARNSLR